MKTEQSRLIGGGGGEVGINKGQQSSGGGRSRWG